MSEAKNDVNNVVLATDNEYNSSNQAVSVNCLKRDYIEILVIAAVYVIQMHISYNQFDQNSVQCTHYSSVLLPHLILC